MKNIKTTRAGGFIIDYIFWYGLMYLMILFYFFVVEKESAFANNLPGYADIFQRIMRSSSFLVLYFGALIVYEIIIPLVFGGQSISKKILKTKIEPFTIKAVVVHGIVKILIINPCGVISYLIGHALFPNDIGIVSDVLWVLLGLNVLVYFKTDRTFQDMASASNVVYIEGDKQ